MNKQIDIDLKGVPQTLLLPLIGRAKYTQESYSPIRDEKAVELVNMLNYDFEHLLNVPHVRQTTLFWMARAYQFDEAIKAYLKKYPDAVIVNLGCGLDTAFNRVDNGQLTWVDIDLPDVIDLRETLLPPSERNIYIKSSVMDYSWMDKVKALGSHIFFYAGGLFMYFTENEIKSLFLTMSNEFPNAHLIFDNISPKGLKSANDMLKKSGMTDALLQWSLYNGKVLEEWSPKIKIVEQHGYFKNIKNRYSFPLTSKFMMYFYDLFHKSGIIHVKFTS